MLRSYSRNTGSTSLESETSAPGISSREDRRRRAARARGWRSCAAARRRSSRCPAAGSRARRRARPPRRAAAARAPSGPMRPPTSKMCSGGTGPLRLHPGEQAGAARHVLAADLEHVLEAGRGDAARRGAPLPSRIRLVAMVVPCRTRATSAPASPAGLQHLGDAVAEAARGIVRRRRRLGRPDAARGRVEQRDVGEGAAGVDADDDAGRPALRRWPSRERRRGSRDGGRAWPPAAARGAWPWPPRSTDSAVGGQHDAVVLLARSPG